MCIRDRMYGEIIKNLEISKVTLLNQKPLINIIDFPRFPLEAIFFTKFQALVLFGFTGAMLASIYVICAFLIRGALELS